ncbi:hypothetical protein DMJ13_03845 [halophilic archaeon]|nr:hypothetical protein DMJ13_03845 [halophilic archaeon]
MTFRDDDRAVSVQVGTVLLFASLVVAMSLYQATVVPNQNHGVEFRHNQEVKGELLDLRNAVVRTGATGTGQPVSVTLDTRYPRRTFFVNPPPTSGTLRTTPARTATVSNATALSNETADYWNGTNRSFLTRGLLYEPNYHEYGDAPVTAYENTVVYDRFDSATVTATDQSLVRGRRITLLALNGSLSRSEIGTVSLDPHAVSPSTTVTRTVSVQATEGENLTVRVPTGLSESKWTELLEDQRTTNGGYVEDVSVDGGVLTLTLQGARDDAVTYDLRMAKVSVGTADAETKATYVTDVRGGGSVGTGESTTLVAEVRDRFNNPVSGVRVNVSAAPGGTIRPAGASTTDESGRAEFVYTGRKQGDHEVTLSVRGGDRDYENATFDVSVESSGRGNGGDGGSPTADLTITKTKDKNGQKNDEYKLDATKSSGDISEYRWDFNNDGEVDERTSSPTIEPSPPIRNRYETLPEEAAVIVVGANGETDTATAAYDNSSSTADVEYYPA